MRKEEFEAGVDELAGTPVEAIMFCLGDGRTVLHDVTVALPLEDEPFLTAPQMRVAHTGVIWLLLFRSLELESVGMPSPTLPSRGP